MSMFAYSTHVFYKNKKENSKISYSYDSLQVTFCDLYLINVNGPNHSEAGLGMQ